MINGFKILFEELEFHGLMFRRTKKCNNYPEEYWDKLLCDGTHYSKIKYLETMDAQMIESIHWKLSYYYLMLSFSILIASFCIILLLSKFLLLAIILFIISAAFYFICWLFLRSAKNEHISMAMNKPLVDVIFEQDKNENN